MRYVTTGPEMQAIDACSIQEIGIPGIVLMERAACAMKEEIVSRIHAGDTCLIVTEKGNNGGDGLALARMLVHDGYTVDIVEIGLIKKGSESYMIQREILRNLGIRIYEEIPPMSYDVYIDAIFGVGLTREVAGKHAAVIREMNRREGFRIALDIPSGIHATTGQALGEAFRAHLTITVGYDKVGLLLYPGASYAGEVVVKDIGFPRIARERVGTTAVTYEKEDLAGLPARDPWSNKGTYGKVLLVVGSKGMAGAAYLSAVAAYRSGCGLVRIFTCEENRQILQTRLPEAILTTYRPQEGEEEVRKSLEEALSWATVVGIGPGIGTSDLAGKMLVTVLEHARTPLVVDADGLNLLAEMIREETGRKLFKAYSSGMVLTPHLMEMSRLTGRPVPEIQKDLIGTADLLADSSHVIVEKDARTIVTDRSLPVYINTSGNHGMAVAGSGDVLTGIICGLLAGGLPVKEAARLGVYVHGLAGDAAVKDKGYYSLMAEDLTDYLPHVLR